MLLPKLSRHVGVVVLMDPPALDLALELAAVLPRVARDTSVSVEQRGGADLAMERYAAGDNAAFAQVYDALAPRLFAYLFRQTRERSRAEDLLQQTMLHIHRARDRFIPGAQVTPWAFAIARRLLVDSMRRGRREILGDGTVVDTGVASSPRADDLVQASQVAVRIELVLAGLPASQRTAFQLIKQEGLTVAEAAQVLGTTVAAVELRAHRAYEALRAGLGEIGVGSEANDDDSESNLAAGLKP
jgi:RNA polymerase sigma-70 factor, ECF subfamily